MELFAHDGVDGTSTRDIAHQAGVAEGTLYRHFRTKEQLADTLFLSYASELVSRLERAVSSWVDPVQQVGAIVEEFFRFAHDEPAAYEYIMVRHATGGLPPGIRLPKDVVIEVVVRGAASGAFGSLDPILASALVVGMVTRSLMFLHNGLLVDPEAIVRLQVARAAIRVLKETP